MINWQSCPALELAPKLVSGAWFFRCTRVPVVTLFEDLEDGFTIDKFVELLFVIFLFCNNFNLF